MEKDTLIAGGGIIGLCTAYYLNKAGVPVTVIDENPEDSETAASYGNAGFISPSHFVPLASPGVISKGLRWMLKSSSPFYIRPRLNRELISWGLKFMRSATRQNVEHYKHFLLRFNLESQRLFVRMEEETGLDFDFIDSGLLVIYRTEKGKREAGKEAGEAREMGLKVDVLNPDELKKIEPAVHPDVKGAVLYHVDRFLDPAKLMNGLKSHLKKQGVEFRYKTRVEDFVKNGTKIESLITDQGNIAGKNIVITGGVWTAKLLHKLRIRIPMQGGKGYNVTLEHPQTKLNYPSILLEASSAVTPFRGRLRLAGTMEIDGYNLKITQKRVENLINRTALYYDLKDREMFHKLKPWAGLRPVTPDGVPYLGKVNPYKNLMICTGHAMMGLSQGAVSGKLLSEIIRGENPSFDLSYLDPHRFG